MLILLDFQIPKDNTVQAADVRRHYIVSQERAGLGKNLHGASVYSNVPELSSGWNSGTDKFDFILKTMWVTINGNQSKDGVIGDFIENGYMSGGGGGLNGAYYKGFYVGWHINGVYSEKYVNGFDTTASTGHVHKIEYLGDDIKYWRVSMNGKSIANIYGWSGDGKADVGFELFGDGDEKLNSKTRIGSLKYMEDGTWYNWNSGAKIIKNASNEINVSWVNGYTSARFDPTN